MLTFNYKFLLLAAGIVMSSCEKLVEIDSPIDSITSAEVFSTDEQAKAAMAGVYTRMINGEDGRGTARTLFSAGLATVLGGFSADELNVVNTADVTGFFSFNTNKVLRNNGMSPGIWSSAYTAIYGANAVVEGIAASTSSALSETARKKLTAEAKFVRALSYFYLVNFFGDVPLALTVDFNQTRNASRASVPDVYKQIISDLKAAQAGLPPENTNAAGERIYPDSWAATALLARVYLYTGDHVNAFKQSGTVIANTERFRLEPDLLNTFLKTSKEAIIQFRVNQASVSATGNATPEGFFLIPTTNGSNPPFYHVAYYLPQDLINIFEPDDKRFTSWIGFSPVNITGSPKYFPFKYKTGAHNRVMGGVPTEYYMVLRLAEQYLIRAEAAAKGASSLSDAIDDLNVIRNRAGVGSLPHSLNQQQVIDAIEKERRLELFMEWGHRWFDLKRTGRATNVLSEYVIKQPWEGDYQLLYPIPETELEAGPNLIPNPGYY
ncbi:RagB/SusD family nutrient uptake outer membrane protein [Pseudobacter ginsenosidimutans]|uniref:SusD-like starch-binding protein associating with outer membrane n=1 Tax=Pseudobacter ginsenosidimutans TaxID=661488 RepID=A0A4Q7MYI4_9BACT|nr:RagB/SusD family nutrient uptake outer membrane protein [Pseudobacter ginsenosidimutans]QEC42927.1 RagB/SusD family nutrient uptake outer membrane protein [Pseudobacter ginsenosidimutans]RZS74280.1 SusD-like starch-binding protein associating with outer membrane [Pseudobacter ginsenosidimutans]